MLFFRLLRLAVVAVLLGPGFLAGGCAPTASVVGGTGGTEAPRLLPYQGPKARIAVAHFEDKTAKGYEQVGEGLAAMFTTALVNSDRYIVLERDLIDAVLAEQDLAAAERIGAGTGAPTGQIEGAELLLTGAVTEFEPDKFGIGGGIVGLGTLVGTAVLHEKNEHVPVGAATYRESHIAIDVRLIDTATSRVLAAVSVESRGQDWGGFVVGEIGGGYSRLPLVFGGFQSAATEKAVRKAIDLAVAAITLQAPHAYFRLDENAFAEGRIFGFAYLSRPALSGEGLNEPVRTARTTREWSELAADLGFGNAEAAPPIDFARRQVVVVSAEKQDVPGRTISIEKMVLFDDRVEITAALLDPPPGDDDQRATILHPAVLLNTEKSDLPFTVNWTDSGL